jgi:phenylacetate-CoA ligase
MSRGEAVYARLPVSLQNVAISVYGYAWRHLRQGGGFRRYREGFLERDRFDPGQWRDWQSQRLREMLQIAWEAPFYRRRWGGLGLTAADIRAFTLGDLERIPPLLKEEIRKAPLELCPGGRPGKGASALYTSGSTGTPLTVYHSREDLRRGLAMRDARYSSYLGVDYTMPHATIRGRVVVADPDSTGPFHRYNRAEKQTYFSPYHLGPETVRAYIDAFWEARPVWVEGYANSMHDLAFLAVQQGIQCPPLKAIVTTSEPSSQRLRADVRRAFGCRATEEYGMVEESATALECEEGALHVFPDCGYVEILDDDDQPCPPGTFGEIVATSFIREAQPFMRYRTGDMAAWADAPCPCGRQTPILATIEGRLDDILVATDGRRLGRLSTVPKHLPGVVFMQFVQEEPGAVLVRVVCEGPLEQSVTGEVRRRLRTRLGSDFEVEFEKVDALERSARGKIRTVVSSVAQRR